MGRHLPFPAPRPGSERARARLMTRAGVTVGAVAALVGLAALGPWTSRTAEALAAPIAAPAPPPDGTQAEGTDGEPFEAPEPADDDAPTEEPAGDRPLPDGEGGPGGDGAEDGQDPDDAGVTGEEDAGPPADGPVRRATVRSSDIPLGSILLAVGVLAAVALALLLGRRDGHGPSDQRDGVAPPDDEPAGGTGSSAGPATDAPARPVTAAGAAAPSGAAVRSGPVDLLVAEQDAPDARTLEFLLELGEALVDAGDAVHHVETTLRVVGGVNGVRDLGVIVLPTALVISAPGHDELTTEVGTAGRARLRLDQVDAVLRLVQAAEAGDVAPAEGRDELARIRAHPPPFPATVVLAGYTLSATGLALILRGGWPEVPVAAALGALMGLLRFATRSRDPVYQPFWPLIAAFLTSAAVFSVGRLGADLVVFPTLIAPLVTFLPGALLTIGVFELATGQMIAGAARLASGGLQLLLLALGIVAGASFVGIPVGGVGAAPQGPVGVLGPWVGVAVFGVGVAWFEGVRRTSLPLVLLVLYVAYAGQVAGGLFFGSTLSAFFGAAVMTPVAVVVARQRFGPPMLVTFLPGFWLLVPGALGLDGVTRILGEESVDGTTALVTAGAAMVGISLGILLGLALSAPDPSRPWAGFHPRRGASPVEG